MDAERVLLGHAFDGSFTAVVDVAQREFVIQRCRVKMREAINRQDREQFVRQIDQGARDELGPKC